MSYQTGKGWKKTVGSALMGLAGIGTLGNLDSDPVSGIIGGLVLGSIGGALFASDKKSMKGSGSFTHVDRLLAKHLKKVLAKTPHHIPKYGGSLKLAGQGHPSRSITNKHVASFFKKHKDVKIHIRDILGKNWRSKKERLKKVLAQAIVLKAQKGGNIFGDIKSGFEKVGDFTKKTASSAGSTLNKFIDGKTKFKPSDLASYMSAAVGVAGTASAFIPGVDLISVPAASAAALGLKSAGLALSTSGRGNFHKLKKSHENYIKKYPSRTRVILKYLKRDAQVGQGKLTKIALGVTGLSLYGFLKENPHLISQVVNAVTKFASGSGLALSGGAGLALSGGAVPFEVSNFFEDYPSVAKKILTLAKKGKGYQTGSGKMSGILSEAGLVGSMDAGVAHGVYNYLLKNPNSFSLGKGSCKTRGKGQVASGLTPSGGGKYKKKKGFIVGSKREVWDDNLPNQITSGGLKKCDLMKGKGNKIISKKRHLMGKKMYALNKSKLTPFSAK